MAIQQALPLTRSNEFILVLSHRSLFGSAVMRTMVGIISSVQVLRLWTGVVEGTLEIWTNNALSSSNGHSCVSDKERILIICH